MIRPVGKKRQRLMAVYRRCALLMLGLALCLSGCGGGGAEPTSSIEAVSDIALSAFDGWWYMPDDYAADGMPLFTIMKINSELDEFVAYDAFANAVYTGPAFVNGDGLLILSIELFADELPLRLSGGNELYDEDDRLAFTLGDELTAPEMGLAGVWYLSGDNNSDYYALNGDNTYSFYDKEADAITRQGGFTVSSIDTHFLQGYSLDVIQIDMDGAKAEFSPDGLIFVINDFSDKTWYMRGDAIGTEAGDAALIRNELTINSWYSDDGNQEMLFYHNDTFMYRVKDEDGWFNEVTDTGTWERDGELMWITWDSGSSEAAEFYVNPTSFYILSLDQGFAMQAGMSGRGDGSEVFSLGGKEFTTSTRSLQLRAENVEDISVLAACTSLEELDLSYTYVKDLSPLAGLTNLKSLDLERVELTDISALAGLTRLEKLSLRGNPITDYSVLANFPNLKDLSVDDTDFSQILPYIYASELQTLVLTNCKVSDLSFLEGNSSMINLMIDDNPLDNDDLSALSGMINLEQLWLGGTRIDDVSALKSLGSLEYLSFFGSEITKITGCEGLDSVGTIELGRSNIVDVGFLKGFTNLKNAGLDDRTRDVSVLKSLPNLESVGFMGDIPESMWADIHELEEAGIRVSGMPGGYWDMEW